MLIHTGSGPAWTALIYDFEFLVLDETIEDTPDRGPAYRTLRMSARPFNTDIRKGDHAARHRAYECPDGIVERPLGRAFPLGTRLRFLGETDERTGDVAHLVPENLPEPVEPSLGPGDRPFRAVNLRPENQGPRLVVRLDPLQPLGDLDLVHLTEILAHVRH